MRKARDRPAARRHMPRARARAILCAFAKLPARNYREVFGRTEPDHVRVLRATAKLALERIAGTDALYHDELHTLFVADVGQAILRGRAMVEPVSREGWLHF